MAGNHVRVKNTSDINKPPCVSFCLWLGMGCDSSLEFRLCLLLSSGPSPGIVSPMNPFFPKSLSVMIFYHSHRTKWPHAIPTPPPPPPHNHHIWGRIGELKKPYTRISFTQRGGADEQWASNPPLSNHTRVFRKYPLMMKAASGCSIPLLMVRLML